MEQLETWKLWRQHHWKTILETLFRSFWGFLCIENVQAPEESSWHGPFFGRGHVSCGDGNDDIPMIYHDIPCFFWFQIIVNQRHDVLHRVSAYGNVKERSPFPVHCTVAGAVMEQQQQQQRQGVDRDDFIWLASCNLITPDFGDRLFMLQPFFSRCMALVGHWDFIILYPTTCGRVEPLFSADYTPVLASVLLIIQRCHMSCLNHARAWANPQRCFKDRQPPSNNLAYRDQCMCRRICHKPQPDINFLRQLTWHLNFNFWHFCCSNLVKS